MDLQSFSSDGADKVVRKCSRDGKKRPSPGFAGLAREFHRLVHMAASHQRPEHAPDLARCQRRRRHFWLEPTLEPGADDVKLLTGFTGSRRSFVDARQLVHEPPSARLV